MLTVIPTGHPSRPGAAQATAGPGIATLDALLAHLSSRAGRHSSEVAAWRRGARTAVIAAREGASDDLVTAALLHQVGHLDPDTSGAATTLGALARASAHRIAPYYGPAVLEPIRMLGSASRYLALGACLGWRWPGAHAETGRPWNPRMSGPERACFASLPHAMSAVRLARWSMAASGRDDLDDDLAVLAAIARRAAVAL